MHCFFIYSTTQETFVVKELIIYEFQIFLHEGCLKGGVHDSKPVRDLVKMEGVIFLEGGLGYVCLLWIGGADMDGGGSKGYDIFLKYTQKTSD